jgi:phenylalanyl-tRNA synthetase beta chain
MKVSLNTIKEFVNIDISIDELVTKINRQLGKVETVEHFGDRYKDAIIVRVVSCEKHPDADRLSVCMVDDGNVHLDVERNEANLVRVVCGAPNVTAGMMAVWLPPGSTVPSSYGEKEPFVLAKREIRGIISNGMLAAGDELAINNDHDGIVSITKKDLPEGKELSVGASFAETFDLNDIIIDIENKMFTHRPDLFGQLGVAREIYAILQPTPKVDSNFDLGFARPDWYWKFPRFAEASGLPLEVFNDTPDNASRFMAVAMKDVEIKPSPLWMQTTLLRWGSKSINNVVDLTNYIMLLTAQPTHAYDYDKLRGHKLGVRMSATDETVALLNGKTYELLEGDIVIVDGEGPVGLAGIMGGGNSEVSAETKNIVLEVATFDMYAVRRSAMRHGIFTDALTRFNKGQSPLQNDRVIFELMRLMPGSQASNVFDVPASADAFKESVHGTLHVSADFINKRLGLSLSSEQVRGLLRYVNFASNPTRESDGNTLEITAPFWRTDIQIPEDIVEEIGRLHGFDSMPRILPQRSIRPAPKNPSVKIKRSLRTALSGAGASEVLTYSFVHEKTLLRALQAPEKAFRLSNALSPDLQYYRLSLVPSLLDKIHPNSKAGADEYVLYEIGKAHHVDVLEDDGLPKELPRVAGIYATKQLSAEQGAAYFSAKRYVEVIAKAAGTFETIKFVPMMQYDGATNDAFFQLCAPFEPKRSAVVFIDNSLAGVVGEFRQAVHKAFKLPSGVAGFELFITPLIKNGETNPYRPLSRFPHVAQDISLRFTEPALYADVFSCVDSALDANRTEALRLEISPVSIYSPGPESASFTFRLTATHYEKTLTDQEVGEFIALISAAAKESFGAEQI